MNVKELFDKSLKLWGVDSQVLMLAEEASELSVAALHLRRNTKDKKTMWFNLAEEIADVKFMIEEIEYYFPEVAENVSLMRIVKVERLAGLIEKESQK